MSDVAEDGTELGQPKQKTSEELRALWRKAILETLLLIRMEKENLDLRGMTYFMCFFTLEDLRAGLLV